MKKKLFLPAMALTFAAAGAFASVSLADKFYEAGDDGCTGLTISQPCPHGSLFECVDGNMDQYYYIPSGSTVCTPLRTNIPQ